MFEIERDIPIPKLTRRGKYPFRLMVVGDSFFVPETDKERCRRLTSILTACSRQGRGKGKFSTRTIKKDGLPVGVRCWKIEE